MVLPLVQMNKMIAQVYQHNDDESDGHQGKFFDKEDHSDNRTLFFVDGFTCFPFKFKASSSSKATTHLQLYVNQIPQNDSDCLLKDNGCLIQIIAKGCLFLMRNDNFFEQGDDGFADQIIGFAELNEIVKGDHAKLFYHLTLKAEHVTKIVVCGLSFFSTIKIINAICQSDVDCLLSFVGSADQFDVFLIKVLLLRTFGKYQ